MSHILFITSNFIPNPDANGVCTYNVINSLKMKGHNISCICYQDNHKDLYEIKDDIEIYRVRDALFSRILKYYYKNTSSILRKTIFQFTKILRKIILLIILPIFPNISPIRSLSVFSKFEKIHKRNKVDCIISTYLPYEGIETAIKAKKKYPNIICMAYYLDIMREVKPPKPMPISLYKKLCYRNELKLLPLLDKVLIPIAGESIYNKVEFNRFVDKIKYIDFPLFVHQNISKDKNECIYETDKINIIYAGSIDNINRNPSYFLKLISEIYVKNSNIRFHLYGFNGCHDIIAEYKLNYPDLIQEHGIAEYSYIQKCIEQADFLLNINNKVNSGMVPSKIFQLFASLKPIINVINSVNDSTADYFIKYPLVCNIYEYQNKPSHDINQLQDFLERKGRQKLNEDSIRDLFLMNTPEFTADFIDKYIKRS